MNHLFNKTRVFITVLLSLFLLSAASTDGQCNGDLDRQYRLETVGTLSAIDNVDGFFTEYVASAFERYFSQQSRLISIDLRLVDLAVSRSKLPYEKVIFDLDLLKRASQSARAESLIRTQVQKAGGIYSFTLEWLHAPKMEVIADLHFEMNEPKGEHGFIGGSLDQDLLSEGLKLQLSKLLHALPFFGQVSGRDREKVTLNIGEDEGLKVGDQVDLATIEELGPDHVSAYELEAKPGTRFAVHHGARLEEQAELLERHMELVIDSLAYSGYDWYEIASFARSPEHQGRHNRAYWEGRDYLGLGVGAVGTVAGERRVNGPKLAAYIDDPLTAPAAVEVITERTRLEERLMLGLRLADGVAFEEVVPVLDQAALERLVGLGLARVEDGRIRLAQRGRMLLHDCVAELIDDEPA
jgi:hypothetical protein